MDVIRHRPDPQKSLVGFIVGDGAYAVPINHVREIINPAQLTELPQAPHTVAGVVDHRNEVVVVLSLRAHLGLSELTKRSGREKWILLRTSQGTIGLTVDQVTDVFGTGGGQLMPAPHVKGAENRGFLGVLSHKGLLTFVLDVRRFEEIADSMREGALSLGMSASPSTDAMSSHGGRR